MSDNIKKAKLSLKRLLLFAGLLFFLGVIISARDWKLGSKIVEGVRVNIIKIDGKTFISRDDVLEIIAEETDQQAITGLEVGELDVPKIERRLKDNPLVKKADVYLDAGNKLYVEITQRVPILRVIDPKGRQYYLSEEGVKMPISIHEVIRLPVATGNIPPYFEGYLNNEHSMLNHLFRLINYIRASEFLSDLTEQIYIDKKDDFSIVPKIGQHRIIIGAVEDLDTKFRKLEIFYKEALPYEGWNKYKTINLKFKDQVVTGK